MTPQQIEIETRSITPQMIADQMVCAFEGGSNYWIDKVRLKAGKAHEEPWYACPKLFEDPALQIAVWDDEKQKHLFGLAEIQEGLQIMADKHKRHFKAMVSENGDAITADVFLQCCALKELVYG